MTGQAGTTRSRTEDPVGTTPDPAAGGAFSAAPADFEPDLISELLEAGLEILAEGEDRLEDWRKRALQALLRLAGCQGIGWFVRESERDWTALTVIGGRSLGLCPSDWLERCWQTRKLARRDNQPAAGWCQLAFPLPSTGDSQSEAVIVCAARVPEAVPVDGMCREVAHVMSCDQLVQRWAAAERAQQNSVLQAEQRSRLLTVESVPELMTALQQNLLASGCPAGVRLAVRVESTAADCFLVNLAERTFRRLTPAAWERWTDGNGYVTLGRGESNQKDVRVDLVIETGSHTGNEADFQICFATDLTAVAERLSCLCHSGWERDRLAAAASEFRGPIEAFGAIGQEWQNRLAELAPVRLPILLSGEPGTGKRRAAQWLHDHAGEARGVCTFLACRRLTVPQLQIWLAANGEQDAQWEQLEPQLRSCGRTLVLEEITEMTVSCQAVLLRWMLDVERVPAGERRSVPRLILTTSQSLNQRVEEQLFLADLAARLSVIQVHAPALRERGDEVPQFLRQMLAVEYGVDPSDTPELTADGIEFLTQQDWPENFRDLRRFARRLWNAQPKAELTRHDLERWLMPTDAWQREMLDLGLAEATIVFQRRQIRQAISRASGNMTEAARQLGLHRTNLYRKMRQLSMDEADQAAEEDFSPPSSPEPRK